jgi:hypothetical protein
MAKQVLRRAGLLVSGIGVFYSGLMFLGVAPGPLAIRFWDGGQGAITTAAVLDIACGSVIIYLAIQVLLRSEVRRHVRDALIVCAVAMFSDWIGGLYGLSALLGLVCSYFILREPGWRTL